MQQTNSSGNSRRREGDQGDARTGQMISDTSSGRPWVFLAMTRRPYPFLVALPFLFTMLICLGLSRPSIIEEEISNLWISDGKYKKDKNYAQKVGANKDKMSTFAAMALSRHGENLFTEENLNAIVERMKLVERAQVTHNGINFTWDDICLSNGLSQRTTYKMPCLRLSAMDLFQEARWYFTEEHRVTWYDKMQENVMRPLLMRYGVLHDKCVTPADNNACDHTKKLRTDPQYAVKHGYSASYAGRATDLLLDIFSLELNDPCQICIESGTEEIVRQLKDDYVVPAFTTLTQQLRRFLFSLEERDDVRMDTLRHVESLIRKTARVATRVSRQDVEDFYMYYTLRGLYGEGAADFQWMYRELNDPFYRGFICGNDELLCPPEDVTLEEARAALLGHADNMFSSHVTFGAPFPFWSSPNGKGHLFGGTYAVGGSGINMSAPLNSLATYLDLENKNDDNWRPFFYDNRKQDGYLDPLGSDYLWETMVSTNPVYAWFMAGETEMTAHCGNGNLLGTNSSDMTTDMMTAELMKHYSEHLCTKYHTPYKEDGTFTQQHFARMWFDLLIDSPFVMDIMKGVSDPYLWTSGIGCGFDLGYSRFSYSGQDEDTILQNASGELYNIDEGAEIGVVDRTALIGDADPPVGEYSYENPLQHVGLLQTIYVTLVAANIAERVKHKNRPGGPLNITEDDARQVLASFKASFEGLWTEGWNDDDDGEVKFVGYFDDAEVPGTIGTFLSSVTMSSGLLTAVSILVIAVFSVLFLARRNPIESRVGITLIGVLLVILAFFASVGLGILIGIKVNLTIAWTLPFILIGLGVDNVYIILMSLQKQGDYSDRDFARGMKEVVIPITMTTLVNLSMFGVMNINSIPAVYLTARVACFAVVLLYLGVTISFPAYCYLDMQRQEAGRCDVLVWKRYKNDNAPQTSEKHFLERFLYDRFYQPMMFGKSHIRIIFHSLIWAVAALLLALGLYGISISAIGLGLEDFLPPTHQGHVWASARTDILGSWAVNMNWPNLDYGSPLTQMQMIKQFENVANTPHIVEIDTRMLWIAELAFWTTRQCDYNNGLEPPEDRICGRDYFFEPDSKCSGAWKRNIYGLRDKYFSADNEEQCLPYDGGVCRPTSKMHPDDLRDLGIDPHNVTAEDARESWCPVFEGWSEKKMTFCVRKWYELAGTGGLVLNKEAECAGDFCKDYMVKVPIMYSSGPSMTAKGVVSHDLTLQMMEQTRFFCDEDEGLHCWMSGPPYDYWSQYDGIQMNFVEISGASVLIGFGMSLAFLACQFFCDGQHSSWKILCGSLVGALLIAANCFFCLVAVVGISMLAGVSLTAFSLMSFVLSVGFAVEYSVHVVSRWLHSDRGSAMDKVEQTMSFLFQPTFMSFVSSTLGIICLAFTDFEFNTRFFFRPLLIVMFTTYFFGCLWLPVFLTWLDFEFVKLGPKQSSLRERVGSPLSKMQESESSQILASSASDFINENSDMDLETNSSSVPMGDCLNNAIGETETKSFDFFPCYNMADCAGSGQAKSEEEVLQLDDNSLATGTGEEESQADQGPSKNDDGEQRSFHTSLSPDQAKADASSEDNTFTPPQYKLPPPSNALQRSAPSSASSQATRQICNTYASRGDPAQVAVYDSGQRRQSDPRYTMNAGAMSLVDAVSTTESGDIASAAELAPSGSSNIFDGIDVVPAAEVENSMSSPLSMSASSVPQQDPRPIDIETSPEMTDEVALGPASTGGIFRTGPAPSRFFGNGLPPLRQSLSSSPRKKKLFPSSPLRSRRSMASDAGIPHDEGRLKPRAQYGAGFGGYDFGHVMDGSAIQTIGPNDPPKSSREILRAESGEVLSVHTVFEDEASSDTVKM